SFFFSSRRRHTRSYGDWSSDVCSSDLFARQFPPEVVHEALSGGSREGFSDSPFLPRSGHRGDRKHPFGSARGKTGHGPRPPRTRSEERRVGEGGRWRGGTCGEKNVCVA